MDPTTEYQRITAALKTVLEGVPGLAKYNEAGDCVTVMEYEPSSLQTLPAMFFIFQSFDRLEDGNMVVTTYETVHRLCVEWQEESKAEEELRSWLNLVPLAIEANPHLTVGGVPQVPQGMAKLKAGRSFYVSVGGSVYKAVDFTSSITCKRGRTAQVLA